MDVSINFDARRLQRSIWAIATFFMFPALLLSAVSTRRAVAQNDVCPSSPYCLAAAWNVDTNTPTTTLGGGGPIYWNSSTNPNGPNSPLLDQLNWSLFPALLNSNVVTAFDSCANDLLTVSAYANIYQAFINPGQLAEWVTSSGGSADPDCVPVTASAIGVLDWFDGFTVKGPDAKTPVTLLITFDVWGSCEFLGVFNPNLDGYPCYTQFQVGDIYYEYAYEKSGPITSHHVYKLKTTSGAQLSILQVMDAEYTPQIQGYAQWKSSFNGVSVIYIDVVTPGAAIISGSGHNYATPANLIAVPAVALQTESAAVENLTAAGLSTGTITTATSATVVAGSVMDSVPAAGAEVPSMFPVNLVVSSGMPPPPCAADASSLVSVSLSGFDYNRTSKLYDQTVQVTNTSTHTIDRPVNVVVENLSSNATLENAAGTTSCFAPGSPHVTAARSLASGKSVEFKLHFTNPTNETITWTPEVDAGGTP